MNLIEETDLIDIDTKLRTSSSLRRILITYLWYYIQTIARKTSLPTSSGEIFGKHGEHPRGLRKEATSIGYKV
jgi:hypothetical protein